MAHLFHGRYLVIINKGPTKMEGKADLVFHESIGAVLSELYGEWQDPEFCERRKVISNLIEKIEYPCKTGNLSFRSDQYVLQSDCP
jgi:hypothetical protein